MQRAAILFLVGVVAALAPMARTPGQAPGEPVGTVGELMAKIILPTSDAILYVGSRPPHDEAQWTELQAKALMLAESANLLMMPSRALDQDLWMKDSQILLDVGKGTLAARYADAVALSLHISAETGDVPMNCFIAALAVEDGLVRTDALLWDTPDKQIRGMGMINLQERTVDLVLRPHLKQTIATAITAAIRVKGPLHDPTLRPEPLQTATDLTRGLIGRALHVVKEVSPEFTDAVKKVSPQLTDAVKKLGVTTNKALSATGVDVPLVIDLLQDSASCESVAKKPAVEALRTFEPADHFPRPEYAAHLPPSAPPSPKTGSGDAVAGKTTERGRSAN